MAFQSIQITQLRNIAELRIEPAPGVNLIYGNNGSGKTTVIEAIYMLGRGKSFRGSRTTPLITRGSEQMNLFGTHYFDGTTSSIGLQKRRHETEIRLNGRPIKRISQIAESIPLQLITPQTYQLLDRGPEYRRKFVEWGVFHVEHDYGNLMRRYNRSLSQRNTALRSDPKTATAWDRELANAGERINLMREHYLEKLLRHLNVALNQLIDGVELEIKWKRGWKEGMSLSEHLERNHALDSERKFTSCGPQRADLDIKINKVPVSQYASRGQQKLIIMALSLAQIDVLTSQNLTRPIVLIDDLAAELDRNNRQIVFDAFKNTGSQLFFTSPEKDLVPDLVDKMFHVEHGRIVASL